MSKKMTVGFREHVEEQEHDSWKSFIIFKFISVQTIYMNIFINYIN